MTLPDAEADVRLNVYDALGHRVATLTPEGGESVRRARFDVSRLAPGVYVARAISGERAAAVARFTIVR